MSKSAVDYWNKLVGKAPDEVALISPSGNKATRKDLNTRSDRLCEQWTAEGLKPRRVIALRLSNGIEWVVAFLACLKLNLVAAPLDPGYSKSEVLSISKDIRVEGIWNGKEFRRKIVANPYVFRRSDISVVKFTSGSTGKAKKLFFSHDEMIADARNLIQAMGIRKEDINLGLIPWGHSYGLGSIVYPLLIQGTKVAWTDTPFPREIGKVCRNAKCTIFPSVPTLIRTLEISDCDPKEFESIRLFISAGARLDPQIAQAFESRFGKRVHNFYGSTETGGICFDKSGEESLSGRSVGKPIKGVSIIQLHRDRFYVASKAVHSYGNRLVSPDGDSMALMADYGRLSGGALVLEGRAKNLIKIGARRINPIEVENQLKSIRGVSDATVFPIDRKGEAVIACALESRLSREELHALLQKKVLSRLRPKKWVVYERFPVTSRGKVDLALIKRGLA